MKTKSKITKKTQTLEPKLKIKGLQEIRHDKFKLMPTKMKKNVSFKRFEPRIQQIDHGHIYHSVNRKGKPNQYCAPIGGHFHQIDTFVDQNGELKAKCGPPLKIVHKKDRLGNYKKTIVPIIYQGVTEDKNILDNHIHDVLYLESEYISDQKTHQRQQLDGKKLMAMQGPVSQPQKPKTPAPHPDFSEA